MDTTWTPRISEREAAFDMVLDAPGANLASSSTSMVHLGGLQLSQRSYRRGAAIVPTRASGRTQSISRSLRGRRVYSNWSESPTPYTSICPMLTRQTEICTSLFAMHHNPEYFGAPYDFIPERWTDPENTDRKEGVQAFLVGSRSCVAKNFAIADAGTHPGILLYGV